LIASISATAPTYPGFASGLSGYPDKAGRGSGRGRTHIDNVISERVEFAVEPGGRTHVESYSSMMQGPVQRPTSPVCGGESPASDGEKTMESFVHGSCNLMGFWLVVGFMVGIYMAPSIIAMVRDHHRLPWIGLLNVASGWTVVG
jgi:hypothetical protein